ncbi:MAG: orotidine 5-phosphate decarboxylase [Hyphomonas sp. BRH_c22]|uniref:orotidine-5'-phosphate decarboxylase n=1 Tax=Hyphomonas sp. BRH_c22 TaxID=1629710 RepID=UPI0005F1106D|nr:orotidine-5'-phosphate decarboxylase [Hyphomonas sp. BRH_c22]KJS37143.1 MAG: orotidine 5-phosphate decarboxylase [Hyphomonas sp. BRH_c22]
MTDFASRLTLASRTLGPLCVGIDPHPGRVPALFGGDTPDGLASWGEAIISQVAGRACVIKPQVGLFERLGPDGMRAFQRVCEAGKAAGLIVIADAKRGDIGSTAEGYAQAYLGKGAPFACDAVTVNPYMGVDTLEPFLAAAEANGKGVVVLARTSNPGAADFQTRDMGGAPLYARVVEALQPAIARLEGESGWSSLMLVAGATGPDEARALRKLAPSCLFLVPGYGTQGSGAQDALAGFVRRGNHLEGGVVNAARSVNFPPGAAEARDLAEWQSAIAGAIDSAQADLTALSGVAETASS